MITWQNSWHWILVMVRVLVSQCTISCLLVCDSLENIKIIYYVLCCQLQIHRYPLSRHSDIHLTP